MTRSRRGQRNLGDEYWSRRPLNGYGPSSENKHITHGIERARARQEIMEEVEEVTADAPRPGLQIVDKWGHICPSMYYCLLASLDDPDPFGFGTEEYVFILIHTLMLHGY